MDKSISKIDNRLVYKSDRETLVIEPWGTWLNHPLGGVYVGAVLKRRKLI
jgi:hypothetical protein